MNNQQKGSDRRKTPANVTGNVPSFTAGGLGPESGDASSNSSDKTRRVSRTAFSFALVALAFFCVSCGEDTPPPKPAAETKPRAPAVPEDVQDAADGLLGHETTVLVVGDLAKTGKQQFLAANVVPKTPKTSLPGTIITRAVMAEKDNSKWMEILRVDQYLKNSKGFMGLTPLAQVPGWRLDYEQDPEKGMTLYFTPLRSTGALDTHTVPIGVRWNPAVKRYQSLDSSYQKFLSESPTLSAPRSTLR